MKDVLRAHKRVEMQVERMELRMVAALVVLLDLRKVVSKVAHLEMNWVDWQVDYLASLTDACLVGALVVLMALRQAGMLANWKVALKVVLMAPQSVNQTVEQRFDLMDYMWDAPMVAQTVVVLVVWLEKSTVVHLDYLLADALVVMMGIMMVELWAGVLGRIFAAQME